MNTGITGTRDGGQAILKQEKIKGKDGEYKEGKTNDENEKEERMQKTMKKRKMKAELRTK